MRIEKRCEQDTTLFLFLRKSMSLSTSLMKRLKWQDALLVNGNAEHVDFRLHAGDLVTAVIEEQEDGFPAEKMPLSILFEDDYLIALDKPAGILVHPSPCRNEGTLANGLLQHYIETNQKCGIHPVSRLDRDTLGVVVFAKSAHIHALFCQMHKKGEIEKNYEAAVFSHPAQTEGTIELPIFKLGDGSLLRVIDARGQSAKSEYKLLSKTSKCAKLLLHPITGRTHQLRVHCLSAGFPILGDPQYHTPQSKAYSDKHGLFTQQLCAASYCFLHPITGKRIEIRSKQQIILPKD